MTGKLPPENSPRMVPPRLFPPGIFPPTKPAFAKYAVDANLFPLVSSILTRVKRATNRNNAATNRKKTFGFFGGEHSLGEYTGVERSGGVYLYHLNGDSRQTPSRKIPPGSFQPGIFPPRNFPPRKNRMFFFGL